MADFDLIGILNNLFVPILNMLRSVISISPLSESINYLILALAGGFFIRSKINVENALWIISLSIGSLIFLALAFIK